MQSTDTAKHRGLTPAHSYGPENRGEMRVSNEKVPEQVEAIAKQAWDSGQRMAMQIAAQPLELREAAFGLAVNAIKESAEVHGMSDSQRDGWVDLHMKLIRQMVTEIDVGGHPQGGKA
jgi:hypothetical protein